MGYSTPFGNISAGRERARKYGKAVGMETLYGAGADAMSPVAHGTISAYLSGKLRMQPSAREGRSFHRTHSALDICTTCVVCGVRAIAKAR